MAIPITGVPEEAMKVTVVQPLNSVDVTVQGPVFRTEVIPGTSSPGPPGPQGPEGPQGPVGPVGPAGSGGGTIVQDVRDFGAIGDGVADDQVAIQTALDTMPIGGILFFAEGLTFNHSSVLSVHVPRLVLAGGGTLRATSEGMSALKIDGVDEVTVYNLRVINAVASSRHAEWEATGILVKDCRGAVISDVYLSNAAAASIHLEGAADFIVSGATIEDSWSDSVHMTGGSHHGVVRHCVSTRSGDDGFACVSYRDNPTAVHDILVEQCEVYAQEWGRGFSIVGGYDITYRHCKADQTTGASVYVACEGNYNTYGIRNVLVEDFDITRANTGYATTNHGSVLVYNGRPEQPGGYLISDVTLRDLRISNTHASGADLSFINEDPGCLTERLALDRVTITTSGSGTPFDVSVPAEALNRTNVVIDGVPQTDVIGWGAGGGGGLTEEEADDRYVNLTGDQMSGDLIIERPEGARLKSVSTTSESFVVVGSPSGQQAGFSLGVGQYGPRWVLFKTGDPETGGDAGSNLGLARYSDTGSWISNVWFINRLSGQMTVGDLETGAPFVVRDASAEMVIDRTTTPSKCQVTFKTSGVENFAMGVGSSSGDFIIWEDDPVFAVVMNISKATGLMTVKGDPTAALGVATKQYVDARTPPILVLGPADPIPGGTAAGTVIVRRAS